MELIKFKVAETWCKENSFAFKVIEPEKINFEKIKELIEQEQIKFLVRY